MPTVVTTLAGAQGVRVGLVNENNYLSTEGTRYNDTDVINSGAVVNPAAAAVIVDSGQLPGGSVVFNAWLNWNAAILDFQIEWRNAANSATIATFGFQLGTGLPHIHWGPFVLQITANERLRVVSASGGTGTADATVMFNGVTASAAS